MTHPLARFDPTFFDWAQANGLHVYTQYRDDEVRLIPVVDRVGHEFELWLEEEGGQPVVRAWLKDRKLFKKHPLSWTSGPVADDRLRGALDDALTHIREWSLQL